MRNSHKIRNVLFGVWAFLALTTSTWMMAWHSVVFPVLSSNRTSSNAVAGVWNIRHYLSPDCACSRRTAVYLIKRGPLHGTAEEVFVIGAGEGATRMKTQLSGGGFRVTALTAEQASARDGIQGVPVLEIVAPDGKIAFRGGYRKWGQSPNDYEDVTLLSQLKASRHVETLPVLGCAVSERLRKQLDPLGLKQKGYLQ